MFVSGDRGGPTWHVVAEGQISLGLSSLGLLGFSKACVYSTLSVHRVSGGKLGDITGLPLALGKGNFLGPQKDSEAEPRIWWFLISLLIKSAHPSIRPLLYYLLRVPTHHTSPIHPLGHPPIHYIIYPSATLVHPATHFHTHPPFASLLSYNSTCLSLNYSLPCPFLSLCLDLASHPPTHPPIYSFTHYTPTNECSLGLKNFRVWQKKNIPPKSPQPVS